KAPAALKAMQGASHKLFMTLQGPRLGDPPRPRRSIMPFSQEIQNAMAGPHAARMLQENLRGPQPQVVFRAAVGGARPRTATPSLDGSPGAPATPARPPIRALPNLKACLAFARCKRSLC